MQVGPACNMSTDMDSTDSNLYQIKQCSEGYYGPACGLCLRNATVKYGRTGTLKCQECRPAGLIVLAYFASTVLVLLLLCFTIHVTLQENVEEAAEAPQPVRASELLRVRLLSTWHPAAPSPLPLPCTPSHKDPHAPRTPLVDPLPTAPQHQNIHKIRMQQCMSP